jgi:PAS domain S-box-containing protein
MRVLIVDDNPDNLRLLNKQLSSVGHVVIDAVNGLDALHKGLANPPDILVTDILMPEMDGYQLCMEWKSRALLKDIPVVFYTATYTTTDDETFAESLGADYFLRKPADFEVFLQVLSEVMAKAAAGKLNRSAISPPDFMNYLTRHNRILLNKLSDKVAELEKDITERQRAEQALKESEEKFRQFFENAQVYSYMVSPAGCIVEVNSLVCKALGYRRDELIGQPIAKLYAPESIPKSHRILEEWNRTGLIENEELIILTKTGQKRSVLLSVGAIKDGSGQVVNTISIQKDITELKESQAKALQVETLTSLNQAKSRLLSDVAHEMRTPLQSIKGFIETLIEPDVKWSVSEQQDFLVEANKETDVLIQLVKDLLDMSRIESGKMRLDRQKYPLPDILESIKARLSVLAQHHTLVLDIPPELPDIYVDRIRVAQVITNLVENAGKFSPPGGKITIAARPQDHNLVISVQDAGIGMTPEDIDKIFDRFYRSEQAVSRKTPGNGLGLSICRGIVEAHGGKIWVDSIIDQGSTFSFSIPISPPEKQLITR